MTKPRPRPDVALNERQLSLLRTSGLSTRAVAEQLDIGVMHATELLRAAGGVNNNGLYRTPDYARMTEAGRRLSSTIRSYKTKQ